MTKTPVPGKPVRGSATGKPIMALFDLLGRRWALGILWGLSESGPMTFRALQAYCEAVSPTVLNTRLKELRASGLVDTGAGGYRVTERGQELFAMLRPLGAWSKDWAHGLSDAHGQDGQPQTGQGDDGQSAP